MLNLKPISSDKFRNKAGRLSGFALACGYIEKSSHNGKTVVLWRDHHARKGNFAFNSPLNPVETKQPKWKFVANLGDVNYIQEGGLFVYIDETGVYAPEMVKIYPIDNKTGKCEIRRVILDKCTFENGVLSDNPYHKDKPAWFSTGINSVPRFGGYTTATFIGYLTGDNIPDRAIAWQLIGDYFGWENLDSYPSFMTAEEFNSRYSHN